MRLVGGGVTMLVVSIGVATGVFSVDALRDAGADLAVPTLADTDVLVDWMFNAAAPVSG